MSDSTTHQSVSNAESDPADISPVLHRVWHNSKNVRHGFESWDDPSALGPGLYFVIERESVATFAEPMGANRWPVEDCASVFADTETFVETTRDVAFNCDGAVIINNDGTIEEEMVRFTQLSDEELEQIDTLHYADWMGARHMSALETSTRSEVVAVITLSEESGRKTIFADSAYQDYNGDEWRDTY